MNKKEYTEDMVRLIIEGAIQEEREACARVCEALDDGKYAGGDQPYGIHYARAIRARGENETSN